MVRDLLPPPLQRGALTAMTADGAGARADGRQELTVGFVVTGTLRDRERNLVSAQIRREWGRRSSGHGDALTALTACRASPRADASEPLTIGRIEALALREHVRDLVTEMLRQPSAGLHWCRQDLRPSGYFLWARVQSTRLNILGFCRLA